MFEADRVSAFITNLYNIFEANKGHLDAGATYYLACLYQNGYYVKRDREKAWKLFYLAHKSNYRPASKKIFELKMNSTNK